MWLCKNLKYIFFIIYLYKKVSLYFSYFCWKTYTFSFLIKCPFCGKSNQVKTSGQPRSGKCGPPAFDINTRLVLGCLHAGIGQTHINNVLSTLNAPTLNSVTFKLREREVGKAVESIAKSSCQNWREKNEALQNVMRVISFQYPVPLTWDGRDVERAIIRALDKQQL